MLRKATTSLKNGIINNDNKQEIVISCNKRKVNNETTRVNE